MRDVVHVPGDARHRRPNRTLHDDGEDAGPANTRRGMPTLRCRARRTAGRAVVSSVACPGCGAVETLNRAGLCTRRCAATATAVLVEAFDQAEMSLTRSALQAALAGAWPELPAPGRVADAVLDDMLAADAAEEIFPGLYRLVPATAGDGEADPPAAGHAPGRP